MEAGGGGGEETSDSWSEHIYTNIVIWICPRNYCLVDDDDGGENYTKM